MINVQLPARPLVRCLSTAPVQRKSVLLPGAKGRAADETLPRRRLKANSKPCAPLQDVVCNADVPNAR